MPPPRTETSITLYGSPPWGFRLGGGKEFNQPLVISRVTPGSVGAKSGLTAGDVLLAINGEFVSNMTQDECETKVRQAVKHTGGQGSLYLLLKKNAATITTDADGQVKIEGLEDNDKDDEVPLETRLSRHNRTAKPFPGSFSNSSSPTPVIAPSSAGKPAGFRSVNFRPKAKDTGRGKPDGGVNVESDLPPPPADL